MIDDAASNMTDRSLAARLARARLFGKSPLNAYLRLDRRLWNHVPRSALDVLPLRAYARAIHRLVQLRGDRQQFFGTFFFRNRPLLNLLRSIADRKGPGSPLSLAFLGCSNGAEVYSALWIIRTARPDLHVSARAVDISTAVLDLARRGVYSVAAPELVGSPIFARINAAEMDAMFDRSANGETMSVKPWLKERLEWHVADAASAELPVLLGRHDVVFANNFLCHMEPPHALRCLRNIASLVKPGGHLFLSGVDLDVRTAVALEQGWAPVSQLMEAIHEGDPALRTDWPWEYWGLEPLDTSRRDWRVRYAAVFRVGQAPAPEAHRPGALRREPRVESRVGPPHVRP